MMCSNLTVSPPRSNCYQRRADRYSATTSPERPCLDSRHDAAALRRIVECPPGRTAPRLQELHGVRDHRRGATTAPPERSDSAAGGAAQAAELPSEPLRPARGEPRTADAPPLASLPGVADLTASIDKTLKDLPAPVDKALKDLPGPVDKALRDLLPGNCRFPAIPADSRRLPAQSR